MARRGHDVVGGVRHAEHVDELRAQGHDVAGTVDAVVLDLSEPGSIADGAEDALAAGPLDVVVNNAAILPVAPVELSDAGTFRATFETNVIGPMLLAQAVLPSMRARGRGLFLTVSSAARHARIAPAAFGIAYAASKAAVDCWAEAFNMEIAGFGLRSAIVELGGFDTEMTTTDRFAASVVPADSPYASVAGVLEELISGSPKAQAADGARCIADVIELAEPPLRTVFPPELAGLIASSPRIRDDAYLDRCRAMSGKDWFRALRRSLAE